ncbi:OmpH family outer membrane protein [uncultured Aquimarina sp.]|uniref:OmpH family outer membrane protein n=1 Tax=uncultured Aquimarina sp. TaxID=575652 RepID=UPI002626D6C8|nr:OmpH family outer membrane protein [uncultured Aquimarina sp.]
MRNFIWVAIALIGMTSCNQQIEKTGYVNNTKVVSDFNEMKTAKDKWTKKNNEVRAELEEKAKQFQIEVQGYQNIMKSMSTANREKKEQELLVKQQGLQREQQTRMQEIQQGSQVEIDSIIAKVENFIKEYGKNNGYTYIYGETEVKNIFYAKEELDLTDKIISELNGDKTSGEEK